MDYDIQKKTQYIQKKRIDYQKDIQERTIALKEKAQWMAFFLAVFILLSMVVALFVNPWVCTAIAGVGTAVAGIAIAMITGKTKSDKAQK